MPATRGIRVYFVGEQFGPAFKRSLYRQANRVRQATRGTAQDLATQMLRLGQSDISRAGDFGSRWTEGLHFTVTEGGGQIRINMTHDVPYWTVFEYGATIKGKPLLWIPLSFATDAKGIWARNYPGALFRVPRDRTQMTRKDGKAPLLGSVATKEFKYFGKEQVVIPQKFHLRQIVMEGARRIKDVFHGHWESGQ